MKWAAPVSRAHPAASSYVQLGLLAAVGGGRVTSAAKGVMGLTMLDSAVGLTLVVVARRFPLGRALAGLSLASVASSCTLLAIP